MKTLTTVWIAAPNKRDFNRAKHIVRHDSGLRPNERLGYSHLPFEKWVKASDVESLFNEIVAKIESVGEELRTDFEKEIYAKLKTEASWLKQAL